MLEGYNKSLSPRNRPAHLAEAEIGENMLPKGLKQQHVQVQASNQ